MAKIYSPDEVTVDAPASAGKIYSSDEVTPHDAPEKQLKKEGVVEGVAKAAGRGFIDAGQGALNTEQNAADLVTKSINISPIMLLAKVVGHVTGNDVKNLQTAQWYKEQAQRLQAFKEKNYPAGNISSSIPGKIIEGVSAAPGMIAQVAAAGGGIPGFAALGAVNKQEEGIGGMAYGAAEGAAMGYLFDKFKGLSLIPRATAGATVGAAQSAIAGNDTDQIIADAATNGMFTAAQPGVMKEILDLGKATGNVIGKGTSAIGDAANTAGKFANKTGQVLAKTPDNFKEFINIIKEGRQAKKDLVGIEQSKRDMQNQVSSTQDVLERQKYLLQDQRDEISQVKMKKDAELAAQKNQENLGIDKLEISKKAKDELHQIAKTQTERDQQLSETQVKAGVENDVRKIDKIIDSHEENRTTDAISTAKDIKSGKIQAFFKSLSSGYEAATNKIFDFVDQNSPVKPGQVLDMLAEQASRIVEDGATDSPVLRKIHAEIENVKAQQSKDSGMSPTEKALRDNIEVGRLAREAKYPGSTKAPKSAIENDMPYRKVRQMMKRITDADQYGSHEADIVRQHFLETTTDLIRQSGGGPDATLSFEKLQQKMSQGISYKQKLARIFGVKGGMANWEEGAKALTSLYNESGMTAEQRIANRANKEAIAYLEKGDDLAKGIGDVSSGLQKRAEKLQVLSDHLKKTQSSEKGKILQVAQEYNSKLQELAKSKQLTDKILERETEAFKGKMQQETAAIEMKYDLADKALQEAVKQRQTVVRKGQEYLIDKGNEIRNQSELARVKREAINKRHEALGFARALLYSLGGVGLWKFSRVGQSAVGMERYSE